MTMRLNPFDEEVEVRARFSRILVNLTGIERKKNRFLPGSPRRITLETQHTLQANAANRLLRRYGYLTERPNGND